MKEPVSSKMRVAHLRPSLAVPLATMGAAFVFGFLVVRMIQGGIAWDPWWMAPITVLLGCLTLMYLRNGVLALASRGQYGIVIQAEAFTLGVLKTPREEVTGVRPDADVWFKGIRVDFVNGSFVRIPAHLHRPGRVLRAFERLGYPLK